MAQLEFSRDAKHFLLKFTALLVVAPLASLLLVRDVIGPHVNLAAGIVDGLAIIVAVVVIQLILLWSCVHAFKPESDEIHEKTT